MNRPSTVSNRLEAEDFRRLGVRPQEFRPTIIRQAAARTTRELAQQQLESPSEQIGHELMQVTVSAYRVLDPRRRDDTTHRVTVGRILPLALSAAGHTRFCNGRPDQTQASVLAAESTVEATDHPSSHVVDQASTDGLEIADAAFGITLREPETSAASVASSAPSVTTSSVTASIESAGTDPIPSVTAFDPGHIVAQRLESDSLLRHHAFKRLVRWVRGELHRPAWVASLIVLMAGTTIWVNHVIRPPSAPALSELADSSDDQRFGQPETDIGNDLNDRVASDPLAGSPASPANASIPHADAALAVPSTEMVQDRVRSTADVIATDVGDDDVSEEAVAERAAKWLRRAGDLARVLENAFASASSAPKSEFLPDPFAESPPSGLPTERVAVSDGPPPVPEEQAIADAYQRLRRSLPQLVGVVSPTSAPTLIVRLSQIQSEAKVGSADYWVANLMAAKVGWSVSDTDQIREGLQVLAGTHNVSVEPLLAESFLQRHPFVETRETHGNVLVGGFSVAESLLRHESFEKCQQVIALARRSAEFLGDEEALVRLIEYEDALVQMSRLRLKANDIVRWADSEQVSGSDAVIAGRYYCLLLRDWGGGLTWLAESKDPRLAALAKTESELRLPSDETSQELGATSSPSMADQLSRLAARWVAVASRHEGRIAESMRLHALTLLEQAIQTSRGTRQLKIQREIDEIRASLSRFAFDSRQNLDSASWTL